MHRIDGYGATVDNLFTEGSPGPGVPVPPTDVTADWLNDHQENACTVIEAAGIALVKGDYGQLLAAILRLCGGVATRTVTESGPVLAADSVLFVDCSAGPVTLSLLSASSPTARALTVIKIDTTENAVVLQAEEGQTLATSEGRQQSAELTMQDESVRILPDGLSHYYRVG